MALAWSTTQSGYIRNAYVPNAKRLQGYTIELAEKIKETAGFPANGPGAWSSFSALPSCMRVPATPRRIRQQLAVAAQLMRFAHCLFDARPYQLSRRDGAELC